LRTMLDEAAALGVQLPLTARAPSSKPISQV